MVSLCLALVISILIPAGSGQWTELAQGIDLKTIVASTPTPVGNSEILVVRIDPDLWDLKLADLSQFESASSSTARQFAETHGFVVAINAGMFATDHSTHVGYMESNGRVNSNQVNDYKSVAAFAPRHTGEVPSFRIFDLDDADTSVEQIRENYASLVQNLRLIKRPGRNRWSQQAKLWSEAALGEDKEGHILFIYSRSPFSMYDLNHELLQADIDLVAAQHLEGGPEAQLYVKVGGTEFEVVGSYETGFNENDDNKAAWPIPNVLGVTRKKAEGVPADR